MGSAFGRHEEDFRHPVSVHARLKTAHDEATDLFLARPKLPKLLSWSSVASTFATTPGCSTGDGDSDGASARSAAASSSKGYDAAAAEQSAVATIARDDEGEAIEAQAGAGSWVGEGEAEVVDASLAATTPWVPTAGRSAKEAVEALLKECRASPWYKEEYTYTRTLQSAHANHGRVDLMRRAGDALSGGGGFVAVKRMPSYWATASHASFKKLRPDTQEQPWLDICVAKYLHQQGFPYVCEPHGVFQTQEHTYVVTAFAERGDLFGEISSERFHGVGLSREKQIRPLARQIITAVRMLHEMGIAHRDISPENIVLCADGKGDFQANLIDFGMATFERRGNGVHGKHALEAPEMHRGEYDCFLCDAFSLGVVLFAMATRDYPWSSTRPGECQIYSYVEQHGLRSFCHKRRVTTDGSKRLIEVLSPALVSLLEGLLRLDPVGRFEVGHVGEGSRRAALDTAWFKAEGQTSVPSSPLFGFSPSHSPPPSSLPPAASS